MTEELREEFKEFLKQLEDLIYDRKFEYAVTLIVKEIPKLTEDERLELESFFDDLMYSEEKGGHHYDADFSKMILEIDKRVPGLLSEYVVKRCASELYNFYIHSGAKSDAERIAFEYGITTPELEKLLDEIEKYLGLKMYDAIDRTLEYQKVEKWLKHPKFVEKMRSLFDRLKDEENIHSLEFVLKLAEKFPSIYPEFPINDVAKKLYELYMKARETDLAQDIAQRYDIEKTSQKLYIQPYVYDADKKEHVFSPELGLLSFEELLKQGDEPPEWLVNELKRHGKEKEMEEIRKKLGKLRVLTQELDEDVKRFFEKIDELYEREAYEEIDKELGSPEAFKLSKSPLFREKVVQLFNSLVKDGFELSIEVALSIAKRFRDAFTDLRGKVREAVETLIDMYISKGDLDKALEIATEFGLGDLREKISEEMFKKTLALREEETPTVHPLVAEAYLLRNIKKYSFDMVFDYVASHTEDLEEASKILEKSKNLNFKKAIDSITKNASSLKRVSQMLSIKTFFVDERGTKYDTGGESFQNWARKYIQEHFEDVVLKYGPIPEGMREDDFLVSKGWSTVTIVCTDGECRAGIKAPQLYDLWKVVSLLGQYRPSEVVVESYPSGFTHTYQLGDILERF